MKMKHNVGGFDAFLRAVIGVLIWASGFIFHSWYSMLGLLLLISAVIGHCPLYQLIGISTERELPNADPLPKVQ
jgi:hypothetical protein